MAKGMEMFRAQASMPTPDIVEPHRISLKSSPIIDNPRVRMLGLYLCGTIRPDSQHGIHQVQI